jgi:hypothetical protein
VGSVASAYNSLKCFACVALINHSTVEEGWRGRLEVDCNRRLWPKPSVIGSLNVGVLQNTQLCVCENTLDMGRISVTQERRFTLAEIHVVHVDSISRSRTLAAKTACKWPGVALRCMSRSAVRTSEMQQRRDHGANTCTAPFHDRPDAEHSARLLCSDS